ncbi:hypothetical protein MRY87_05015 [bacterium]|nr:hypothetical protein [bacterium]
MIFGGAGVGAYSGMLSKAFLLFGITIALGLIVVGSLFFLWLRGGSTIRYAVFGVSLLLFILSGSLLVVVRYGFLSLSEQVLSCQARIDLEFGEPVTGVIERAQEGCALEQPYGFWGKRVAPLCYTEEQEKPLRTPSEIDALGVSWPTGNPRESEVVVTIATGGRSVELPAFRRALLRSDGGRVAHLELVGAHLSKGEEYRESFERFRTTLTELNFNAPEREQDWKGFLKEKGIPKEAPIGSSHFVLLEDTISLEDSTKELSARLTLSYWHEEARAYFSLELSLPEMTQEGEGNA